MSSLRHGLIAALSLDIAAQANAADIETDKKIATSACAACHGANGVSIAQGIPNLGDQRTAYTEKQLKAYKY